MVTSICCFFLRVLRFTADTFDPAFTRELMVSGLTATTSQQHVPAGTCLARPDVPCAFPHSTCLFGGLPFWYSGSPSSARLITLFWGRVPSTGGPSIPSCSLPFQLAHHFEVSQKEVRRGLFVCSRPPDLASSFVLGKSLQKVGVTFFSKQAAVQRGGLLFSHGEIRWKVPKGYGRFSKRDTSKLGWALCGFLCKTHERPSIHPGDDQCQSFLGGT